MFGLGSIYTSNQTVELRFWIWGRGGCGRRRTERKAVLTFLIFKEQRESRSERKVVRRKRSKRKEWKKNKSGSDRRMKDRRKREMKGSLKVEKWVKFEKEQGEWERFGPKLLESLRMLLFKTEISTRMQVWGLKFNFKILKDFAFISSYRLISRCWCWFRCTGLLKLVLWLTSSAPARSADEFCDRAYGMQTRTEDSIRIWSSGESLSMIDLPNCGVRFDFRIHLRVNGVHWTSVSSID